MRFSDRYPQRMAGIGAGADGLHRKGSGHVLGAMR